MERMYTISKDNRSSLWYAHKKGYRYTPVAGSASKRRSDAQEYAKMMDCLPNRVQEIENRRREEFLEWLCK